MRIPCFGAKTARALLLGTACLFAVAELSYAQDSKPNRAEILRRIEDTRLSDQDQLRLLLQTEFVARTKAPNGWTDVFLGDSNPDLRRFNRTMAQHSQNTAKAESAYRQALTAQIIANTRGLPRDQARAYITKMAHETFLARQRGHQNVRETLRYKLSNAKTDAEKAKARAFAESILRTRALEDEVYQSALRRHDGQGDAARMRELLRRIANRKTTLRPSDIANSDERAREEFLRRSQTELEVAEYRRLARSGTFLSEQNGQPVSGQSRLAMARDAEQVLVNRLNAKALRPSRYDILAFTLSKDERAIRAETLAKEIKETPEYVALDMLSPADFGNQGMRYLAVASALRQQQQGVADWRAKFVKGTDTGIAAVDGFTSMLQTGAADYSRIWDNAGDMSLSKVDARISRYNAHVDQLIPAITEAGKLQLEARRAGKPLDLSKLSARSRELLIKAQMLQGKPGQQRLVLNDKTRVFGGLNEGLNLPGDHFLNSVSGLNMLEMAATTYIPAAGSGKVAKMLEGLKVSRTGVQAARFGTDLGVGMILTGATDYAKTGKVDPSKIAIESSLLQLGLGSAGSVTNGAARAMASHLTKNPTARAATEKALRTAMGLPSEAMLQSVYQAKLQGSDVSYEMFLANLMNAGMSRGVSHSIESPFLSHLPKSLRRKVVDANDVVQRSKDVAEARLKEVLGDQVTGKAAEDGGIRTREGTPEDTLRKTMDEALSSGKITWGELTMLYGDNPGLKPVLQAVNNHRAEYFQKLVEPAQNAARRELTGEFTWRSNQIKKLYANDPTKLKAEEARLQREYDAELKLINTAPKAPGSDNLTSDVDRSIASERVRRQLKQMYRNDRGGYEIPASSAQSYDVNEYINVFPDIRKTMGQAKELANIQVKEGDYNGLTQDQAIEAQGMATAMLHMNAAQRDQYRRNVRSSAGDRALADKQLAAAGKSLLRADREMQAEMQAVARDNPNLKANPADLAVRARDNLYGRRTEAIRKDNLKLMHLEHDIQALKDKKVPEDAPERVKLEEARKALQAKIHRDWGFALREGIETYASFSGLDSIVSDGQMKKIPIRELINNKKYYRVKPGEKQENPPEGVIEKELSDRQVQAFLDDQINMMTHHVNGLHKGGEDVVGAASALGKYGERAVLGLKLQGKDLTKPPYLAFSRWSEAMVKNRKDPEKLKETLREISSAFGGNGNEKHGLLQFVKMAEASLPGAKGVWDAKAMGLKPAQTAANQPPTMQQLKTQLANRRRMLEEEEELRLRYGPASARKSNETKRLALKEELTRLEAKKARRAAFGKKYLREDWDKAESLEAKERSLQERLAQLGKLSKNDKAAVPIINELRETRKQLEGLRNKYKEKGGNGPLALTDQEKLEEARMAAIREELKVREKASEQYEALAKKNLEKVKSANPLPAGQDGKIATLPFGKSTEGQVQLLTVTLGSASLQIKVQKPKEPVASGD